MTFMNLNNQKRNNQNQNFNITTTKTKPLSGTSWEFRFWFESKLWREEKIIVSLKDYFANINLTRDRFKFCLKIRALVFFFLLMIKWIIKFRYFEFKSFFFLPKMIYMLWERILFRLKSTRKKLANTLFIVCTQTKFGEFDFQLIWW